MVGEYRTKLCKMKRHFFVFVLLCIQLSLLFASSQASRILVLSPMGTKSHAYGFLPLVEALAEKGHQITLVTAHAHKTKSPNIKRIVLEELEEQVEQEWFNFRREDPVSGVTMIITEFRKAVDKGYRAFRANKEIQEIIRSKSADLVILDAIFNEFTLPIIDHLGVPFIYHSPGAGTPWTLGAMQVDQQLASVPMLIHDFQTPMAFPERVVNVLSTEIILFVRKIFVLWMVDDYVGKDFPGSRPAEVIERDAALCLANIDSATVRPRSLPPTVIPVGPMHCRPAQPLPQDLHEFANGAKEGFILFTLGSNARVSSMPDSIRQMFVRVFARLPERVIWKWEKDDLLANSVSPNVKLVNWLPQQDLLGHKKARLFITHGGLLGAQEAVYHQVPILGLPLGRDQRSVLAKGEAEGMAKKLEWEDLTEEVLYDTIRMLIDKPGYTANARRLSSLMKDQLVDRKDVGVYWVEHVLRHGGTKHLQSTAKDMPLYQRYLLDVAAFLMVLSCLCIYITYRFISWTVSKCLRRPHQSTKLKSN